MNTLLTLDEMRLALAPFDLRPRRLTPVEQGTVNSNFRVETDGGTVFVRVNEGKREADVRYEAALLWHLGVHRFPTPQPLRTSAGEGYARAPQPLHQFITVFPWVTGEEIAAADADVERVGQVGEALARLHVAAADFPLRRGGVYTFEHIAQRIEGFRARAADLPEIAEALPILDEEVVFLRGARRALEPLPIGTIHGDLFPDNLLWKGREVAAVLDFEQASRGRYTYDLAVALLAWCTDGARLEAGRAWSMVSGYQRVRPLSPSEREALWVEARTAALRFAVTRITDVYLPSLPPESRPARPGKDYRDYLARLRHLREEGEEALDPIVHERPPLRAV